MGLFAALDALRLAIFGSPEPVLLGRGRVEPLYPVWPYYLEEPEFFYRQPTQSRIIKPSTEVYDFTARGVIPPHQRSSAPEPAKRGTQPQALEKAHEPDFMASPRTMINKGLANPEIPAMVGHGRRLGSGPTNVRGSVHRGDDLFYAGLGKELSFVAEEPRHKVERPPATPEQIASERLSSRCDSYDFSQ